MKMFIDISGDFFYANEVIHSGNVIIPTYCKGKRIKMRKRDGAYRENYETVVLYDKDAILWTVPLIQDE